MYVGIDYSLSSPAICISPDDKCSFFTCKFYFLTSKKKYEGTWNNIFGDPHKPWDSAEERYHNISSWAMSCMSKQDAQFGLQAIDHVFIEDYAMGAKGRVFHIGENAGALKMRLYRNQMSYSTISPAEVKKYATGKGNSDKNAMHRSFRLETGVDLKEEITPRKAKVGNPVSDIVDSYYICKLLHEKIIDSHISS